MACPRGAPCSGHGQQGHRVPTGCKVQPVCPQGAWDVAGTARTSPRVQGMAVRSPWGAGRRWHGQGIALGCRARPRCPHGVHGVAVVATRSPWGAWHSQGVPKAPQGQGAAEGHEGVRGGVPAGTCTPGISTQITWPGSGSAALLRGRGTQGHRDTGTQGRGRFPQPQGGAAQPRCSRTLATSSTAALRHHGHGRGHAHSPWLLLRSAPNPAQENGAGDVGTWGRRGDMGTPCRCCPFSPHTAQRRARHRLGGCSTHFPQHGSLAKKIADSGQPESLVGQK